MADKKSAAVPAEPAAPVADKPKRPLILIIGISLLTAALVGGGVFFLMPKGDSAAAEGEDSAAGAGKDAEAEAAAVEPTVYVEIKQPLVINLTGSGPSFLQVEVQLATRGDAGKAAIETHLPAIRSALLILLRQTTGEELAQADVMVKLQASARTTANRVIEVETKEKGVVTAVLFTSFVTQ